MNYYVGVDVQTKRGCPFAILDESGTAIDDGWIDPQDPDDAAVSLRNAIRSAVPDSNGIFVAVDAPSTSLTAPRQWYWDGKRWRKSKAEDRGTGRHCEIVIAAHRLANPQWTPCRQPFPQWMELGFAIFKTLSSEFRAYEVFPSASYRMFEASPPISVSVQLNRLGRGPKDMLDAYVAAATLREFCQGRGCEIGGGDGLGSIILPRPIQRPIDAVLIWPERT